MKEPALDTPTIELLERCRQKNTDAMAAIVARFRPWAVQFAASMLGDADLAEDAVQDALITAFQRLDDLRQDAAFKAWFRQIVRTEVCRILRRGSETLIGDRIDQPSGAPSPRENLERKELADLVRQTVDKLPPKQRQATEEFYFEERSCSEMAAMFEVSVNTIKSRLYGARSQLRDMLSGFTSTEHPPQPGSHPSKSKRR
jgi:RNA polymerase sigma-70 factor (ECF subfamily)